MTKPREQSDLEAAEQHFKQVFPLCGGSAANEIEWQAFFAGCRHKEAQLASELAAKEAEIARLREALAWYADQANHEAGFSHDGCATKVNEDNGERARKALNTLC